MGKDVEAEGPQPNCCHGLAKVAYSLANFLLMLGGGVNGGLGLFPLLFPDSPSSLGLRVLAGLVGGVSAVQVIAALMALIGLAHGARWVARLGHYLWLFLSMAAMVETGFLAFRLHQEPKLGDDWEALAANQRQAIMLKVRRVLPYWVL